MKSRTTKAFRHALTGLPRTVRVRARVAYRYFVADPAHPSLKFKKLREGKPHYSARVGGGYRVLGTLDEDTIIWFWIGAHDEYERRIAGL